MTFYDVIQPGDVISYLEMCAEEGTNIQRGMNFQLHGKLSVILMSLRPGAPYADRIEEKGKVLIYEGHNTAKSRSSPNPKVVDQPMINPNGRFTQNGKFYRAAMDYKGSKNEPELVKVYEKIRSGIWVYNGLFKLVDAWQETCNARKVFKFRLEMKEDSESIQTQKKETEHSRLIPASVKLEVWKRDKGRCIKCGSTKNLHFDHIIPFSKGGSSLVADNIQILCAKCNIAKKDKIV